MTNAKIITLCALSGIVGLVLGAFIMARYWGGLMSRSMILEPQAGAFEVMSTLKELRKPDLEAGIKWEEMRLDSHIISLGFNAHGNDQNARDARRLLRRIAAYRKNTSYAPETPELKQVVEEALSYALRTP
jgi:hypothetical protein